MKNTGLTDIQLCYPINDEDDSEEEPIHLEGGRRAVIRRRIISPRESTMQEEGEERLDDLVSKSRKRKPADPEEGTGQADPPVKKRKKEKKAPKPKKAVKPKKAAKPKKATKPKKAKKQGEEEPPPPPPMGEEEPQSGATPGGEPRPSTDPMHSQPGDTPPLRAEGDPDPLEAEPQNGERWRHTPASRHAASKA